MFGSLQGNWCGTSRRGVKCNEQEQLPQVFLELLRLCQQRLKGIISFTAQSNLFSSQLYKGNRVEKLIMMMEQRSLSSVTQKCFTQLNWVDLTFGAEIKGAIYWTSVNIRISDWTWSLHAMCFHFISFHSKVQTDAVFLSKPDWLLKMSDRGWSSL